MKEHMRKELVLCQECRVKNWKFILQYQEGLVVHSVWECNICGMILQSTFALWYTDRFSQFKQYK